MFCMNVKKRFLSTVATWYFEFFTFNIVTEKKAFILGCSESECINTINYHLKYYIYTSRCKENPLLLTKFQNIWKEVYYIERNIAFRNKCMQEQFENKWKLFENLSELKHIMPHIYVENHFIVTKKIFMKPKFV